MILLNDREERVLSYEQKELLPLIQDITQSHILIGGTAIALQLGHRKSIDFDCINSGQQGSVADFKARVEKHNFSLEKDELREYFGAEFENQDELHFTVHGVKISLFNYYRTLYDDQKIQISQNIYVLGDIPSVCLEQLLCMKLFACITRNKWKDAVDIYFLLHHYHERQLSDFFTLCEDTYFINIFNRQAVLEQFISGNWDTTEKVEYLVDTPPSDKVIIQYLQSIAFRYI